MALSFFTKNKKAIQARCRDDYGTKMRLKYAPWYHTMESQRGTTVTLDGREMIMLSSNDYLGLSFHPKVIEPRRAQAARDRRRVFDGRTHRAPAGDCRDCGGAWLLHGPRRRARLRRARPPGARHGGSLRAERQGGHRLRQPVEVAREHRWIRR